MRRLTSRAGFSIVEGFIVIVVVLALGFVGYKVYQRQQDNSATTATSQQANQPAKASDVASAPGINSTSDLDKAAATLDQTDPAGSNNTDSNQLSSQADTF